MILPALELGDLQILEQTLLSQKKISQKNEMINYLLTMIRDMNIEKLEQLARDIHKQANFHECEDG